MFKFLFFSLSDFGMSSNNIVSKIENSCTNCYRGYYTPGYSYSIARIAECIDTCRVLYERDRKLPTMRKFMVKAKIGSKDLAMRLM